MNANATEVVRVQVAHCMAVGISDPGQVREENEDSILLDSDGRYMLLADGMGGHERGAEASRTTLEIIREGLDPKIVATELMDITAGSGMPSEVSGFMSIIDRLVRTANETIYERNRREKVRRFMGTTLVGLIPIEDAYALWFHIGDSRIYRLRNGQFKQLTRDHSAFNEWKRGGCVGEEPGKNIITRAIGPMPAVVADIDWGERQPADLYLLCSDGLSDMLSDDRIKEIMSAGSDVQHLTEKLIEDANAAGGKDNVSAVICRF